MNKLFLFIKGILFWLVRYMLIFLGLFGVLFSLVVFVHPAADSINPLVFLLAGTISLILGLVLTYFSAGKTKKGLLETLFDDLIVTLLPPW